LKQLYHGTSETPGTFGTKIALKSPFLTLKRPILQSKKHKKALFFSEKQGFFA
jgi:hypothetical protein